MAITVIPLQPIPSQTTRVQLSGQACQIDVIVKTTGVYVNLYVSDVLIVGGVVARDRNFIVRDAYLGFIGDLAFYDLQGASDPTQAGLGERYVLVYVV